MTTAFLAYGYDLTNDRGISADEVRQRLVAAVRARRGGDPYDEDGDVEGELGEFGLFVEEWDDGHQNRFVLASELDKVAASELENLRCRDSKVRPEYDGG